ncbi:hypothetical protein [Schwartzia succinivorans]|nr:hypothetical protein [Schwartzia succinivorans]
MRRAAEKARRLILQVPNVQKVELLLATALTLLVLPTMYAAFYRIKEE